MSRNFSWKLLLLYIHYPSEKDSYLLEHISIKALFFLGISARIMHYPDLAMFFSSVHPASSLKLGGKQFSCPTKLWDFKQLPILQRLFKGVCGTLPHPRKWLNNQANLESWVHILSLFLSPLFCWSCLTLNQSLNFQYASFRVFTCDREELGSSPLSNYYLCGEHNEPPDMHSPLETFPAWLTTWCELSTVTFSLTKTFKKSTFLLPSMYILYPSNKQTGWKTGRLFLSSGGKLEFRCIREHFHV